MTEVTTYYNQNHLLVGISQIFRDKTQAETQREITYALNKSRSLASENSDFVTISIDEIPEKN